MAANPLTTFRPGRACGHADCSTSTGLCGRLTFGRGRLSDYGYWAIPCRTCAAAFETAHPAVAVQLGGVWPTTDMICGSFPYAAVKLRYGNPTERQQELEPKVRHEEQALGLRIDRSSLYVEFDGVYAFVYWQEEVTT